MFQKAASASVGPYAFPFLPRVGEAKREKLKGGKCSFTPERAQAKSHMQIWSGPERGREADFC